jgi:ATP-dependent exoDNAse (exonuclease V) beta subunit
VLSLEGYTELGRKMSPNFTESRPLIYVLWQQYEKVKRQMEAYDSCDLVAHIYKRVMENKLMPHAAPVHRAYVDEVQDFTSGELLLMCRTVEDPNGLFMTGDTAQTIARGLSFRFQDITTIFKHLEDEHFEGINGNAALGTKKPQQIHKLVNNFRTHSGILDVANLLVSVLCKFFPYSIDNLQPDRGLFPGPAPWLLNATSYEDLQVLLLGSNKSNAQIEFGAQQCIIVREQASKERLPPDLRSGLVCTVFESKGLEFEDVLIYNFFKDSPAKKEWRCLYDFHEKFGGELGTNGNDTGLAATSTEEGADATAGSSGGGSANTLDPDTKKRLIEFDAGQHKLLLEELRHLYTAITRARVRVWVYDEDKENRQPMWWLLNERKLAKMIDSVLEQEVLGLTKGATTTEAEWAGQGKSLYDKGRWSGDVLRQSRGGPRGQRGARARAGLREGRARVWRGRGAARPALPRRREDLPGGEGGEPPRPGRGRRQRVPGGDESHRARGVGAQPRGLQRLQVRRAAVRDAGQAPPRHQVLPEGGHARARRAPAAGRAPPRGSRRRVQNHPR